MQSWQLLQWPSMHIPQRCIIPTPPFPPHGYSLCACPCPCLSSLLSPHPHRRNVWIFHLHTSTRAHHIRTTSLIHFTDMHPAILLAFVIKRAKSCGPFAAGRLERLALILHAHGTGTLYAVLRLSGLGNLSTIDSYGRCRIEATNKQQSSNNDGALKPEYCSSFTDSHHSHVDGTFRRVSGRNWRTGIARRRGIPDECRVIEQLTYGNAHASLRPPSKLLEPSRGKPSFGALLPTWLCRDHPRSLRCDKLLLYWSATQGGLSRRAPNMRD
ncbi:hypothetical protein DFH27DRAFT_324678 [Peziza echinospora]|nr:hypothetical protein DFH27DRAFT_324678 [Peziza echinospora]